MLTLPPLPSWEAIHPLVVHFPIAQLLVAPLFIVIGLLRRSDRSFQFMLVALILMALGTVGTFVATSSGEAAGELAENIPQAKAVLEHHQDLAETTEIAVFCAHSDLRVHTVRAEGVQRAANTRHIDSTPISLFGFLCDRHHHPREHSTSRRAAGPRTGCSRPDAAWGWRHDRVRRTGMNRLLAVRFDFVLGEFVGQVAAR